MKNKKERDELSIFFTVELIKNWFKYSPLSLDNRPLSTNPS